jgi:hypothetical protein
MYVGTSLELFAAQATKCKDTSVQRAASAAGLCVAYVPYTIYQFPLASQSGVPVGARRESWLASWLHAGEWWLFLMLARHDNSQDLPVLAVGGYNEGCLCGLKRR